MDTKLQILKREAVESGDYVAYEAALARAGMQRIVARRLLVAHFREIHDHTYYTEWTCENVFRAPSMASGMFKVDLTKLKPGYCVRGTALYTDSFFRVLAVEEREHIVPTHYLQNRPTLEELDDL